MILRWLPGVLVLGTLAAALPSLGARMFPWQGSAVEVATLVTTIDIYAISLAILHWTAVFTLAIGAFTVMVMKGPAYVADAYPLEDSETPDPPVAVHSWRERLTKLANHSREGRP
jgi:hypothetical protein